MYDDVETYERAGIAVRIVADDMPENPYKAWDQASEILYSGDYDFGAEPVPHTARGYSDPSSAAMCRYLTLFGGYVLAIPWTLQDYGSGGLRAYLTTPDDSPASGYLVLTRDAYEREFGAYGMPLTGDAEHTAEKTCRGEFESFRAYVEGDVYGYIVAGGTADEDSCYGFYESLTTFYSGRGELPYVMQEANAVADSIAERRAELRRLPWLPTFGNPIRPAPVCLICGRVHRRRIAEDFQAGISPHAARYADEVAS